VITKGMRANNEETPGHTTGLPLRLSQRGRKKTKTLESIGQVEKVN
jgi:hypothetical protein